MTTRLPSINLRVPSSTAALVTAASCCSVVWVERCLLCQPGGRKLTINIKLRISVGVAFALFWFWFCSNSNSNSNCSRIIHIPPSILDNKHLFHFAKDAVLLLQNVEAGAF